ncbi:MAG: hypothetical protein MUF31_08240 [Akkermansiaceae bacterium]|jgi:hypothetical protein|nr:hypothetical protein [Akkermansiaceae bacterium]
MTHEDVRLGPPPPDGGAPRAENTAGVLLEHFDLSPPYEDGSEGIVYRHLYETAMKAAAWAGWSFRSYSSQATPGTLEDWMARKIRSFPTLIVFRDGVELGRHVSVQNTVPGIIEWASKLPGMEDMPAVPSFPKESPIPTIVPNISPESKSSVSRLREELERCFFSPTSLEVVYFGGGLPGARRLLTPLRYCETRGRDYIIAWCHRSGIEKTFRLDRMHLPEPPLPDGRNDFRIISKCLGKPRFLDGMLAQIARLGNLPMEDALASHLELHDEFETFFNEYSYGGYTLELTFTSKVVYLSLGYEANDSQVIHYEFTAECEPRLSPGIATHYSLLTGR